MKITIVELEEVERQAFEPLHHEHELELVGSPLSANSAADHADAEAVSTVIYSRLDRPVLEQLPHLRLVATRSTRASAHSGGFGLAR